VKKSDKHKNDQGRQEIVGLVKEQVVDDPLKPSLFVIEIGNLEPKKCCQQVLWPYFRKKHGVPA
jgi:hypothetical protein